MRRARRAVGWCHRVQAGYRTRENPVGSRMLADARAPSLRTGPRRAGLDGVARTSRLKEATSRRARARVVPCAESLSCERGCCPVEVSDWKGSLGEAFDQAVAYLEGLPARPVRSRASLPELRAALGGP